MAKDDAKGKQSKAEAKKKAREEAELKRRQEEEEARKRAEEEERLRIERERQEAKERIKRTYEEYFMRLDQLKESFGVLQRHQDELQSVLDDRTKLAQWNRYMRCDGLPDPKDLPQLNAYISTWAEDEDPEHLEINMVLAKCAEVLKVLREVLMCLDDFREIPKKKRPLFETWIQDSHNLLQKKLDLASYALFLEGVCQIKNPASEHVDYFIATEVAALGLWRKNTLVKSEPKGFAFKEMGITFEFPVSILEGFECIFRVMKTSYDHYSHRCRSLTLKGVVEVIPNLELLHKQQDAPPAPGKLPLRTQTTLDVISATSAESKRKVSTASSITALLKKEEVDRSKLKVQLENDELNLREYAINGGVYHVNLLQVPPEPKKCRNFIIVEVEDPPNIREIHFVADYKPPRPPTPNASGQPRRRDPEEIERELRQQEAELQKLVWIEFRLPRTVLWFEPPVIVRWDESKDYWSTSGFYDHKYVEEQLTLTVRFVSFGIFALAQRRFANFPYQSWDLKPLDTDIISYTISAAVVTAEFNIKGGLVCLTALQNGAQAVLTHLYNDYMVAEELLKEYGVNLKPEADSPLYIEGLPIKDLASESHLYRAMAVTVPANHYAWSRWNLLAGVEKLVIQYKEKIGAQPSKNPQHALVLVTPDKAAMLDCSDTSQAFSEAELPGYKFTSDMSFLIKETASEEALEALKTVTCDLAEAVYEMLNLTRPMSYA